MAHFIYNKSFLDDIKVTRRGVPGDFLRRDAENNRELIIDPGRPRPGSFDRARSGDKRQKNFCFARALFKFIFYGGSISVNEGAPERELFSFLFGEAAYPVSTIPKTNRCLAALVIPYVLTHQASKLSAALC